METDDALFVVTPGEEITRESDFMRGHGTFTDQPPTIISSVAGVIQKVNKLVSVVPVQLSYVPEIGDVVVGRVIDVSQKKWKVDVCGRVDATLHLAAVNLPGGAQRRKLESDELQMLSFFKESDVLVAEVQQISHDGSISLHTRSLKYGKLRNGVMARVRPSLVDRLKSHFIELPYGIDVIIGINGMIWICVHVDDLTLDQVEQNVELLYSDKCVELSRDSRVVICRIYNCIGIITDMNIHINEPILIKTYEASLDFEVRALLEPSTIEVIKRRIKG